MHEPVVGAKEMNVRGFSGSIGDHVLSLPIFQNTAALAQAVLIIECKTPGMKFVHKVDRHDSILLVQ